MAAMGQPMYGGQPMAAISPLEMCAVGGLVRRGARSYVWRVTTVPVCLL